MKKALPVVVLLVIALLLAACGGGGASSAPAAPAEGFLDGTVADATMNTLLVKDANGTEYLFGTEDVQAEGDGLVVGATVTVYFTGELVANSSEMQAVTVTRVAVTSQPASQAPSSAPGVESPVSGTVTDATMNSITVQTADGATYLFEKGDDTVVNSANGILVGDEVDVYFEGTVDPTVQNVQSVSVGTIDVTKSVAPAQTVAQPHHAQVPPQNANPVTNYVSGTVLDATMNTLTIQSIYGNQYTFNPTDATQYDGIGSENGLAVNDTVAVYYEGALDNTTSGAQNVTVTRVKFVGGSQSMGENTVATTPAGDVKVINGQVDDVLGDGTFYLVDATGVDFLLNTQGADVEAGSAGLQAGDAVTVYYIGDLVDQADLQNVTVTQVQVHH